MYKDTILVLGNGFDISLDRKTRYKDFCDSDLWPFEKEYENKMGLGNYLLQRKNNDYKIERWIDLEEELYKYCKSGESCIAHYQKLNSGLELESLIENDRKDYELLCSHLSQYLRYVETDEIKDNSPAARVFQALAESEKIDRVFSFNYTNLDALNKISGLPLVESDKIVYIHGKVDDNTAILGIDDQLPIDDNYRFMVKQFNKNFFRVNINKESNSLDKALREAKDIVFFGCSFGVNDIAYFKSFFDNLDTIKPESVTIFTYDEKSRMGILDTLSQIKKDGSHSVKFLGLFNDFQIITTENNGKEIQNYIDKAGL